MLDFKSPKGFEGLPILYLYIRKGVYVHKGGGGCLKIFKKKFAQSSWIKAAGL